MTKRLLIALTALALLVLAPASASAAPAVSGEFPTVGTLSGAPRHLTQGSDGNIWAVLDNNNIAKVTPAGAITEYTPSPALNNPSGITTGPDKNLWITQTNAVVKISPSAPTVDTPFTITEIGSPQGITTGPNGDLWTASDTHVIDIPPASPASYKHYEVVTGARGIARGGDGKLWVADFGGQRIVSVTTAGVPTSYATAPTGGPMGTAAGPGTQIAFSDPIVQPEEVGLITPGGTPKRIVALGGSGDPTDIVFGNDGAYWFTRFGADDLLRLTPTGAQTALKGLGAATGPRYLTKGPGDTLWVGLETAKKIARVTGVSAPATPPGGGGGGGGGGDTTAPVISALRLSHRTFRIGSLLPKLSRRVRVPVGTTISFRLSEASRVTLRFVQYANGRRRGSRCVRNRRSGRRCRITLVRGTLALSGKAGANTLRFQGRIARHRTLAPGGYTLQLSARDAAGNVSKTKQTRLTLRR